MKKIKTILLDLTFVLGINICYLVLELIFQLNGKHLEREEAIIPSLLNIIAFVQIIICFVLQLFSTLINKYSHKKIKFKIFIITNSIFPLGFLFYAGGHSFFPYLTILLYIIVIIFYNEKLSQMYLNI